MGQYWLPVNLDKQEFIDPHKLGSGLKLWEQLANHPGTNAALIVLLAAMPAPRGGGDLDLDVNWHGPERKNMGGPGPMPEEYPIVAARTIGRWAGDRIALVGDYAEDSDLPAEFEASKIYKRCRPEQHVEYNDNPEGASYSMGRGSTDENGRDVSGKYAHYVTDVPSVFTDITDDVVRVIEHEMQGKYTGTGWRDFVRNEA